MLLIVKCSLLYQCCLSLHFRFWNHCCAFKRSYENVLLASYTSISEQSSCVSWPRVLVLFLSRPIQEANCFKMQRCLSLPVMWFCIKYKCSWIFCHILDEEYLFIILVIKWSFFYLDPVLSLYLYFTHLAEWDYRWVINWKWT